AEEKLALSRDEVVAVDRVTVGLDVVGSEEEGPRVVEDGLEERLDLLDALDRAEGTAAGRLEIQAGILLPADVARDDHPLSVRRHATDRRGFFAAGHLDGIGARSVEPPDLARSGDVPGEVEALAVRRDNSQARRPQVVGRLDAARDFRIERRRSVPRDLLRRDAGGAEARVPALLRGRGGKAEGRDDHETEESLHRSPSQIPPGRCYWYTVYFGSAGSGFRWRKSQTLGLISPARAL